MDRFQSFINILRAFSEESVDYILIGGVAVILHGFPRLTEDVDILIKIDSGNLDKLKKALRKVFGDSSIEGITLRDIKEYAVVRYGTPDGFCIDLIRRVGEVADYENIDSEEMSLENVKIKVATAQALYRLKKDSARPKDQNDALFLKGKLEYLKKEQE